MKVTVEDKSSVKKILHIEVPQEDVTKELDSAYAQVKKTAKIKGFRPGKAPRSVLKRLYGKDVSADVAGKLIQSGFIEALTETKLAPVGSPKVNPPDLKEDSPYAFDAEIEIRPEIDDIAFKEMELNKTKYEISESEVELQLKMLRKNLAKREKIEENRPIQMDDVAVIDYEGFKDGQPFEPTKKTEDFIIKLGAGQIVKDLDDGIVGMAVDEEREIEVTFPDDYFKAELIGQQVLFKVKLKEIREEILPDLDDEFAKSIGEKFDSMESLKAEIRKNLSEGYKKRTEQEINEQVFTKLLAQTAFDVPESMVERELEHIVQDAERSFEQSNRSLDEAGLTKEILNERYRPTAEKQVRRHLILSKIIEQEKLELSNEELDQGFEEMADTYQQPVDHIKGYYKQNKEGMELFKHTMLEKKALKLIIDNGQITEVEPTDKADSSEAADEAAAATE